LLKSSLYSLVPSTFVSSTPVIVTSCGAFQLEGVNVIVVTEHTPSEVSVESTSIVTSSEGAAVKNTSIVVEVIPSVVVNLLFLSVSGATRISVLSSSIFLKATATILIAS
jgi:hypothetical protein